MLFGKTSGSLLIEVTHAFGMVAPNTLQIAGIKQLLGGHNDVHARQVQFGSEGALQEIWSLELRQPIDEVGVNGYCRTSPRCNMK